MINVSLVTVNVATADKYNDYEIRQIIYCAFFYVFE